MKRIILSTAAVFALAAPAMAQSQLERELGVEAGQYTGTQLVRLKAAANETGNDARVYFGTPKEYTVSSTSAANDEAERIFESIAMGSDDGIDRVFAEDDTSRVFMSTQSHANARAAQILDALGDHRDGPNS
ncbi:hypothetical protein Ga0609869_002978 [Rhodovulum iodosum]|uniref:Uncharacterized protein n=1 Tax=Rhodovulum iodosum TaxID=68291 RepID=A0ABV3XY05_9RHOB|nr:hypothetical protein [Rhodovulum robiginosum]RSK36757.1 hypothetical protein EJA01_04480 [Rhodovulum robiginosum]